tara:strand:- start:24 stop:251 length:228 start_codon:yes stop_codon:yes gene_type:complete
MIGNKMTKTYETPELRKWLASRPEVGVLNKRGGGLKFYTNFPFTEVAPFEMKEEGSDAYIAEQKNIALRKKSWGF